MKMRLLSFAFMLISSTLVAQNFTPEDLEDMQFRNVGPAGMSGRVTTIDFDHHTNTLYVGSASGGLWKSENEGQTWTPIFENEKTSSIGAVAVDPTNPDVIWVGTGEGNPRNSQSSGFGMYKSIDGGESWIHLGLEDTRNIHRVIVDPSNPNTVYAAAIGVAWGDTEARGVYKTTDGGATWEKVLYNNNRTGAADMVMDPQNPNKLIVAMWEYRRWPWEFKSGGEGSGIYVTYDGGETWTERTSEDGLPEGTLGRCGLAISQSHPDIVYALVEAKDKNALYRSDDGGMNWRRISDDDDIGNRPFYYADIYVDPQRPDRIFSLWSVLTRSDDAGRTWRTVGSYSFIHPDHHAFWIDPRDPDHVIDGNDGGLNISYDGGNTWRFIDNLPLAQFYHIRVDNREPYHIYGGMQDNGTWDGPAYVWRAGGVRNDLWEEIAFGDGFDVVIHPEDENTAYAMSQEGFVSRIDLVTGYSKMIRPIHPEGVDLRFNWNAAIAQDPFNADKIYFGSQFLHMSDNTGDSWEIISPDLTTNDPDHQKADVSGGLTYDVTGAENYTTILAIAPSPVQEGVIWVGTDDGRLHITQDGGENWTDLSSKLRGVPQGAWIPQIMVDPNNAGTAWVVVNDYRRNNWEPYLYKTTDFGRSFERMVTSDDVHGYVLSVMPDPEEPNLVFLGTENGLYFSLDGAETWQKWGEDLPTVPVADMAIQEREADLILGTFGRSAWVLDDIRPLREMAGASEDVQNEPIYAFDAPYGVRPIYRQARGLRFGGSAVFSGDNRGYGARFSYWINKDTADENFTKNKKVQWHITNAEGDTIRYIERDYEDGFNRVSWDMQEKGVRYPSMREPRGDNDSDPGNVSALPGVYTIHIRIGDHHAQTDVELRQDPRLQWSMEDLEMHREFERSMIPYVESVATIADNLRKAKRSIELIEGMLKIEMEDLEEGDTTFNALKAEIKSVKDSLEAVRLAIFGKENVEGYFEQPEIWSSYLGTMSYHTSDRGRVTGNAQNAVDQFKEKTQEIIDMANEFFEEDWSAFESEIEDAGLSAFNRIEDFNLTE